MPTYIYKIGPHSDKRAFGLISDALPFGRLWHDEPDATGNTVGHGTFYSRSHDAVIWVYDSAGKVDRDA